MAEEIPTEALQAAARAYNRTTYGQVVAAQDQGLNAAVRAAAPYLIAEGRRQAAQAIRDAAEREEQPLVRLRNGNMVCTFEVPEWDASIAEGGDYG